LTVEVIFIETVELINLLVLDNPISYGFVNKKSEDVLFQGEFDVPVMTCRNTFFKLSLTTCHYRDVVM